QFLTEVWRGVPVTDEALTQCIKTLRRKLGDDASRPRFIETVPKHGYRFIAPVEVIGKSDGRKARRRESPPRWQEFLAITTGGIAGGGIAGIIGGGGVWLSPPAQTPSTGTLARLWPPGDA